MPKKKVVAERRFSFHFMPYRRLPQAGGIYKLWFGEKYYIGRSRCLYTRMYSHRSDLFKRVNGLMKPDDIYYDPELDAFKHIVAHLKTIPELEEIKVQILCYCSTDDELVAMEQKWLTKAKKEGNCLNYGFVAAPYKEPRGRNDYKVVDFRNGVVLGHTPKKQQPQPIKKPVKGPVQVEKKEKKKKQITNIYAGLSGSEKIAMMRKVLDDLDRT